MNDVQHAAPVGDLSLNPLAEEQVAGSSLIETLLAQKDPFPATDVHASDDPERVQAAVESSVEAIIEEKRAKERDLEARPLATETSTAAHGT